LFLLVVDLSQPVNAGRIRHWFFSVVQRAPTAVIRVVGTKIDRCKDGRAIRTSCAEIKDILTSANKGTS
jgi:hypothetical protein